MNSESKETIETTATYGGATIYYTNFGNYIVYMGMAFYHPTPNTLAGAQKMIDDANKSKRN